MAKDLENQGFSLADVMAILQQQNELNQQNFIAAVQELKKPTEAEAKKLADEKARHERNAKQAAADAMRAHEKEAAVQAACSHKKADGSTRWGGQVNGDGHVRFFCNNCMEILPPVKAPQEWMTNGVNCHAAEDVAGAMRHITRDNILQWHATTAKDCKGDCKAAKYHKLIREKEAQPVGA